MVHREIGDRGSEGLGGTVDSRPDGALEGIGPSAPFFYYGAEGTVHSAISEKGPGSFAI